MIYQLYRGQLSADFEIKTRAQPYTCRTLGLMEVFSIMSALFFEAVNSTCLIPKDERQKVTESCSRESKLG
jgi:hypothetical protein